MAGQTYISILRGINVSGQKIIKMDALKKMFADIGFPGAATYIQSGNVVFRAKKMKIPELEALINRAIQLEFRFDVPVLVLTLPEVKEIAARNPFLQMKNTDVEKLHVTFLRAAPDVKTVSGINKEKYFPDDFSVLGRAVYVCCPNGYGRTKLNNNFFEHTLNVAATTRNWKTTLELISIAEGMEEKP